MKKIILLFIIAVAGCNISFAQARYIIRLKDKGTSLFSIANPSVYLSSRAIQRRTKHNINIDSADLPVTPRYIDSIRFAGGVTILNTSKWLNQVAIQTNDAAALAKINNFSFVINSNQIANIKQTADELVNKIFDGPNKSPATATVPTNVLADYYSYGQSYGQVHAAERTPPASNSARRS